MKRAISLAVSVILLFSMLYTLTGCNGEDPKIVGTWQAKIDYASIVNTVIYSADSMKDVGDYFKLDIFPLTTTFIFFDNGTFSVVVDANEIFQSQYSIRSYMAKGMEQYLAEQIRKAGLNISADDYLAMLGLNRITLGELLLTNYTLGKISEKLNTEVHGLYRAEDGKLYMTNDAGKELTDENYDLYQIEGDTLTLLECHCHMDEGFENIRGSIYPITLTRVCE